MIDPFKVTRVAYNVLHNNDEDPSGALVEADVVRRSIDDAELPYSSNLMAYAIICDELLRQVNNIDPTNDRDPIKMNLELLWEICNAVADYQDLKQLLGK